MPDSYPLGGLNEGARTMAVGLELEHGGGFGNVQRAMLKAAVQACKDIKSDGRPLIEQAQAQVRLARSAANLMVSEMLTSHAVWASSEKRPNAGFGPMARKY